MCNMTRFDCFNDRHILFIFFTGYAGFSLAHEEQQIDWVVRAFYCHSHHNKRIETITKVHMKKIDKPH